MHRSLFLAIICGHSAHFRVESGFLGSRLFNRMHLPKIHPLEPCTFRVCKEKTNPEWRAGMMLPPSLKASSPMCPSELLVPPNPLQQHSTSPRSLSVCKRKSTGLFLQWSPRHASSLFLHLLFRLNTQSCTWNIPALQWTFLAQDISFFKGLNSHWKWKECFRAWKIFLGFAALSQAQFAFGTRCARVCTPLQRCHVQVSPDKFQKVWGVFVTSEIESSSMYQWVQTRNDNNCACLMFTSFLGLMRGNVAEVRDTPRQFHKMGFQYIHQFGDILCNRILNWLCFQRNFVSLSFMVCRWHVFYF